MLSSPLFLCLFLSFIVNFPALCLSLSLSSPVPVSNLFHSLQYPLSCVCATFIVIFASFKPLSHCVLVTCVCACVSIVFMRARVCVCECVRANVWPQAALAPTALSYVNNWRKFISLFNGALKEFPKKMHIHIYISCFLIIHISSLTISLRQYLCQPFYSIFLFTIYA